MSEPNLTLDGVASLLDVLADGRESYGVGYPDGEGKEYLRIQTETVRTIARIFRDRTTVNAGLFLPTHMLPEYEAVLAALGIPIEGPVSEL